MLCCICSQFPDDKTSQRSALKDQTIYSPTRSYHKKEITFWLRLASEAGLNWTNAAGNQSLGPSWRQQWAKYSTVGILPDTAFQSDGSGTCSVWSTCTSFASNTNRAVLRLFQRQFRQREAHSCLFSYLIPSNAFDGTYT